jgi:LAO/AO transport system kinase
LATTSSHEIGPARIADILVVGEGDREGAERTMQQLLGALSIRSGGRGKVPVLKTTATTGEGVAALAGGRAAPHQAGSDPRERRRRRARYLIAAQRPPSSRSASRPAARRVSTRLQTRC